MTEANGLPLIPPTSPEFPASLDTTQAVDNYAQASSLPLEHVSHSTKPSR